MKWEKIKNHPVFIGGHRKSGTTLFASLLDGHPDLFVYPGETAFFYKFYPIFDSDKYSCDQKEKRVIEAVLKSLDGVIKDWIGSNACPDYSFKKLVNLYQKEIHQTSKTTQSFFEAAIKSAWEVLSQKKETQRYWVEKTTSIEIYADVLFDWYPGARFIHILRDPRDNYASIKSGWDKEYKYHFDSTRRLLQSVVDRGYLGMKLADINLKRFGGKRYLVIKYEDLVADTKKIMRQICRFLKIDFHKSLLTPTFCGVLWKGNNFKGKEFKSVSAFNLNRWKKRINDQEAKVLEFYFSDLMEQYGYNTFYDKQESADAARDHYKWFNYAQTYSLKVPTV